jgi:hypothetical protein
MTQSTHKPWRTSSRAPTATSTSSGSRQSARLARLKQQSADIVNELKEAFRTQFYADDQPAKVEPWLEPLLDGAAATSFTAHPRRYTATMSQFMAELEGLRVRPR